MFELFRNSCKFFFGYYPKSNVQTKTNQKLEQYLSCFTHQQDDWVNFLHLAEFDYKNLIHSSTVYSPFFANMGFHPHWTMLEHPKVPINSATEDCLVHLKRFKQPFLKTCVMLKQKKVSYRQRLGSSMKFQIGDHGMNYLKTKGFN